MSELKTQPTDQSVEQFLNSIADEAKRRDAFTILELMQRIVGAPAQMWGDSIVGFGRYRYRYASGRAGEWFLVGFAPRKQNLTLYIMAGFEQYDALMARLGKHTTGKSCLYIKKLGDIDLPILEQLIALSVAHMKATNEWQS